MLLELVVMAVLYGSGQGCPDIVARWCPTPVEIIQTAPPPPITGVEQWREMVDYYWDGTDVNRMLKIMDCESGGDPWAWNKSTDVRGLFQVRYPLWSKLWPGNYFDPWTNAAIAYQVWLEQGYRAWQCSSMT